MESPGHNCRMYRTMFLYSTQNQNSKIKKYEAFVKPWCDFLVSNQKKSVWHVFFTNVIDWLHMRLCRNTLLPSRKMHMTDFEDFSRFWCPRSKIAEYREALKSMLQHFFYTLSYIVHTRSCIWKFNIGTIFVAANCNWHVIFPSSFFSNMATRSSHVVYDPRFSIERRSRTADAWTDCSMFSR